MSITIGGHEIPSELVAQYLTDEMPKNPHAYVGVGGMGTLAPWESAGGTVPSAPYTTWTTGSSSSLPPLPPLPPSLPAPKFGDVYVAQELERAWVFDGKQWLRDDEAFDFDNNRPRSVEDD
jgi:hypothetical protein